MTRDDMDEKTLTLISGLTLIRNAFNEEDLFDYLLEFVDLFTALDAARDTNNHSQWQSEQISALKTVEANQDARVIALEIELEMMTRRIGELELIAPKIVVDEVDLS